MEKDLTKFIYLCEVLEEISKTKKRLEIQQILSKYFKKLKNKFPDLLIQACYLCLGRYQPEHFENELGIGETQLIKIISEVTNKNVKNIKQEFVITGDLGLIASKYKVKGLGLFKKTPVSLEKVHSELIKISEEKGTKSSLSKSRRILTLISNMEGLEIKYFIRILESKLKIGLALKTVLISLGISFAKDDLAESIENVKYAFNCQPVFEIIIPYILENGTLNLKTQLGLKPGIPLKPMLAQPTKNFTTALKRIEGEFTCEYKYDGERAQIHKTNQNFKVYSRNSEDLTEKYPDIKEFLAQICKSNSDFILDCEVVAYDIQNQKILPFQILTTRKRKNVFLDKIEISICLFVFDILYFNKSSLIETSFRERRQILFDNFIEIISKFQFVTFKNLSTVEEIDYFFQTSIQNNCEGIMIKKLDKNSQYTPSKRCYNWIKLKKDYINGCADSLDLVIIGCYFGKGKRTGTFGGFLMGCYNDEDDTFETICKLGTGFDDESLIKFYTQLKQFEIHNPTNILFKECTQPDMWIEPKFVWEIQAAGLSISPIYTAGSTSLNNKGISLRFPRFIRERNDKGVKDCTHSSQVISLYNINQGKESDESSGELE